ncbi:MAG: class I SAM-dependent methyltransferase [Planctomycetes bacterium]|nr:class I SAM-dependent methyltransferase [Planctomycetota bacterium]MCB9903393.1 class I SAM-dependent methyltransferase [Planctomycetota bacterium]
MSDASDWDAKHQLRRHDEVGGVDPFVSEALDRLGPGEGRRALDLAAGRGRHALELARRGYEVTAVDSSAEALEQVSRHARAEGLQVATRLADLESEEWARGLPPADLILVVNYLDRALFTRLSAHLRAGGRLLLATFTKDRVGDRPSERWCLEAGELASAFANGIVELCEERNGRAGVLTLFGERSSTR